MSTVMVGPLRQRMIEDMNARQLCAGTQRGHIHNCKRFVASQAVPGHGHGGGYPPVSTASFRDGREHLLNRNRIMTGLRFLFRVTLRRLDLAAEIYHLREPRKNSSGDEPGRDPAPASGRRQPQGARAAQSRLWLRSARRRGGQAEGQAHRQRAEDHSGGAVQEPQGPQCHAVARPRTTRRLRSAKEERVEKNIETGNKYRHYLISLHQQRRHPRQKPDAIRFRRLQRRARKPEKVPHQGERHGARSSPLVRQCRERPRWRSSIAKPFSIEQYLQVQQVADRSEARTTMAP